MQEESLLTNVNSERENRENRGKLWRNIRALPRTKGQVFPHWREPHSVRWRKHTHTPWQNHHKISEHQRYSNFKSLCREKQVTGKASEIKSGIVFLNIYTENYEAMENVLKILMKNYFQTRIPYPAKSSLEGEIKIKFSVMQGFSSFMEDTFHQKEESQEKWRPGTQGTRNLPKKMKEIPKMMLKGCLKKTVVCPSPLNRHQDRNRYTRNLLKETSVRESGEGAREGWKSC